MKNKGEYIGLFIYREQLKKYKDLYIYLRTHFVYQDITYIVIDKEHTPHTKLAQFIGDNGYSEAEEFFKKVKKEKYGNKQ